MQGGVTRGARFSEAGVASGVRPFLLWGFWPPASGYQREGSAMPLAHHRDSIQVNERTDGERMSE
jgi:hypothetical protein